MPTNTRESGLETLIVKWLVEQNGYEQGTSADYNREYAVDEPRLFRFLEDTQPEEMKRIGIPGSDISRKKFLDRLRNEIAKRGIINVLRNGIKMYPASLIMFYMTPSEKNPKAKELFDKNIFSVTRQLQYSVADKFQTGYDEPLLHTMYVDKILTDIKAVQTLSRLNRAHPQKHDTFVLDFANDPEDIQAAFSRYYRTTILSGETDPNKLYDFIAAMESHEVYTQHHIDSLVNLYLGGAERDKLDPILDICTALYNELDENAQVEFKSAAKGFVRTYGFLGAILPYGKAEWEKLSIFLTLLLPKLPSPIEEDLSAGILEAIDLDSYRAEKQSEMAIILEDSDAVVYPVPTESDSAPAQEAEVENLSVIIRTFNDLFGNIVWKDADNVRRQISRIPAMVSKDQTNQNAMRNADKQEARTESDRVLQSVIFSIMADNMELFKQFNDNPAFKKWLSDMVFNTTYNKDGKPIEDGEDAMGCFA